MSSRNLYPKFDFRVDEDLFEWLKDYSARQETSMASIIKEQLLKLKGKDRTQQKRLQRDQT